MGLGCCSQKVGAAVFRSLLSVCTASLHCCHLAIFVTDSYQGLALCQTLAAHTNCWVLSITLWTWFCHCLMGVGPTQGMGLWGAEIPVPWTAVTTAGRKVDHASFFASLLLQEDALQCSRREPEFQAPLSISVFDCPPSMTKRIWMGFLS